MVSKERSMTIEPTQLGRVLDARKNYIREQIKKRLMSTHPKNTSETDKKTKAQHADQVLDNLDKRIEKICDKIDSKSKPDTTMIGRKLVALELYSNFLGFTIGMEKAHTGIKPFIREALEKAFGSGSKKDANVKKEIDEKLKMLALKVESETRDKTYKEVIEKIGTGVLEKKGAENTLDERIKYIDNISGAVLHLINSIIQKNKWLFCLFVVSVCLSINSKNITELVPFLVNLLFCE